MSEYKAYLIDLDGVMYEGMQPVPGAAEALARLRQRGIPYRYVTNTSTRDRAGLAATLTAHGIACAPQEVFCPAYAAAEYLRRQPGSPTCAVFARAEALAEFHGLSLVERGAQWLAIGDLEADWTYARLNQALRLLLEGAGLIALGMTRFWKGPDGPRLDLGAYAAALSYAAGVQPVVMGKPDAAFFQMAVADMGVQPNETAMIGDDIVTDVGGAQAAGLDGLLVRTGKFRPADLQGSIRPNAVLNSIAELIV
jgi:HAD superfamily hydrolase (TIGR01458 family)